MPYRPIGSRVLGLSACMLALGAALEAGSAHAHDPGMSVLTLIEQPGEGSFQLVVADENLPERRRASSARCDAQGALVLLLDDRPLATRARCRASEPGHTAFEGRFTLERSGELGISLPLLRELPRGHESFVRLLDRAGATRAQRMLTSAVPQPLATVSARPPQSRWAWRAAAAALVALLVFTFDRARNRRVACSRDARGREPCSRPRATRVTGR